MYSPGVLHDINKPGSNRVVSTLRNDLDLIDEISFFVFCTHQLIIIKQESIISNWAHDTTLGQPLIL